jgi:hypothetical protein
MKHTQENTSNPSQAVDGREEEQKKEKEITHLTTHP